MQSKRNIRRKCIQNIFEKRIGEIVHAAHFHSVSLQPVSYTHLDVYKRQGESLRQAKRQCNPRQVHNSSLNHTANLLVLIAGMIRFGLLITQDDTELSL